MSFQSPSAPICLSVKILSPVLISGNSYSCTLRIYPQQINGATDNYTVSNVSPNFWVSNYSGGQSWKINSISNVNTELQTLDCVIEDVEYYNYSLDVTIGQHGPSDNINGYCFQLGDNGLPNLVPIYTNTFTISQTFISDLTARFNSRNYSTSYISVLQNGHSFVKGNFIGLNVSTGTYVLATSSITYLEIIGVVTSIGIPTVNYFTFRPFGQYLKASEIPTALTQGVGSIYYLDSSGNLTITNTYDSNPVYIQVSSGGDGILLKYRSPSLRTAYLNNIQGSTTTQSVSLFSSSVSPATISIGNTGGDTLTINPPVTSNGSVTLAANKTLTLNSTGGKVLSNVLTGTTTSSAITIGESGDTSTVTINKDTVVATSKSLTCDTFTGNNATTAISLFGTTTASNIALGAGQTTGSITLGHATPASDSGTLTINKLVSLPENKTITLNSTGGKVLSNVLTGTTTSSAITIGESGDTSTVTINKDAVLASGKTLTLNNTGGKVLSNVLTGTTTSSAMTIGESGDTSTVTINKDTVIASGKTLTLNSTGGKVICNTLEGTAVGSAVSLFGTTTSTIALGNASGGTVTINPSVSIATSKSLACDTFTGNNTTTAISLFGTTTASNISLGAVQTTGGVIIGHSIPASDSGTLTINKNTTLASGKILTLNTTGGKVLSNVLTGTTTSSAMTIGESGDTSTVTINKDTVIASGKTLTLNSTGGKVLSNVLTGTTTSSAMTIGESGDTSTVTINKDAVIASGKTLTLNSTGGKVLSNVLTGTTTSSAVTIGESGDTSTVTINKDAVVATSKSLACDTFTGNGATTAISLFGTTTASNIALGAVQTSGNITLGNTTPASDLGTLKVNKTTTFASNKNLTLNGTGSLTLSTSGSINCMSYNSTSTAQAITIAGNLLIGTIDIGPVQTTGNIRIGNTTPASDLGTLTVNKNTTLASGKNLTLNGTGSLTLSTSGSINCMSYNSTSTAQSITIAGNLLIGTIDIGTVQTSGSIRIGNTTPASDSGTLTINKNAVVATSKSLACDTFTGNGATTAISLFGTTTASNIALGAVQTSGNITLGNTTPASDLGTLTINKVVVLPANKTITLNSTGGSVLSPVFNSTSATQALLIGNTNTSANINIGAGQTTGGVIIGHTTPASDSGTLTINKNAVVATSKSLACDTFTGNGATTAISLFGTTTASNIALGAVQTSGNITLGNTTPASDLGTLTINKVVVLPANKTITLNSTGGSVLSPVFNSTSATQALTIGGSNTTASITIGGALTSGAINLGLIGQSGGIILNSDVNIGTSAFNKGIACNYLSNFNNSDLMRFAPILTTGNVRIGETQTTGGVTIGHSTSASDSGTLYINKNTVVAQSKNIYLGNLGRVISNGVDGTDITSTGFLFDNLTTGSIFIGGTQTTGDFRIGNSTAGSDSGTLTINKNLTMGSGKLITATGGLTLGNQTVLKGGKYGTATITAAAYTNVILFPASHLAGFYQIFIYGSSSTQTYNITLMLSADNSGAVQTIVSRNLTFQFSGGNYCTTATVAPTSTITITYNVILVS